MKFAIALLLASCHQEPSLQAVRAAKTRVETTVTTISSGTVQAQQQAVLGFGVTGRIAHLFARTGERVRAGQKIAELDNRDVLLTWQDAKKELARAKELLDAQLVSPVAFDEARRAEQVARANFERSVILAPFDGMITEMNLDLGAQVTGSVTKTPVRLVDLKPRIVKGDIDEIDLAKVKVGEPARVRIPAARPQPFEASVSQVVPYVDTTKEQDRTSQIELRMTATEAPIPVGASAEIEIVTAVKETALAVPTRVLLGSGGDRYVFRFASGRLSRASVKLGIGNYERTEVVEGLAEGDLVAYPSDTVELRDGMKVKVSTVKWP